MGFSDSMDSAGEEFTVVGPNRQAKRGRERHSKSSTGSDGESQQTKTRKTEIAVIVKLKGNTKGLNSLQLVDCLAKEIGHFQHAKTLANGRILVVCNSKKQQDRALALTSLNKCDVEVFVPGTGSRAKGVVYGVPTEISDEDILANVKGAKVCEVKRFQITKDNEKVPSQTVLLTFDTETIPRRIGLGYLSFQVKPYIRPPLRCFNCHRYGHVAAVCRAKRKCGKCGGDHNYEDCNAALCCPNCGGNHSAGYKGCRVYASALEVQKVRTNENVSYAEALRRVKNVGYSQSQQVLAPRAQAISPPSDSFIIKKVDFLAFISDVISGSKFSKVANRSDVIKLVSAAAGKYLQVNVSPESLFNFLKEREGRVTGSQSSVGGAEG